MPFEGPWGQEGGKRRTGILGWTGAAVFGTITVMISLGILSWHAHETLTRTLDSYAALSPLVDERVIWFNEISDADRALAAAYGFDARGTSENLGILGGTHALLKSLSGDIVLSCQNDNPVSVPAGVLAARLAEAVAALRAGEADWVRLRNRFEPGFSDEMKFLRYWGPGAACALRRLLRPGKAARLAGRAVAACADPSVRFPRVFRKSGGLFLSTSRWVEYTDQPFAASRAFILEVFDWIEAHKEGTRTLNGRYVPEIVLNRAKWWRKQAFPVAVSEGVFAHARYDDSFRPGNAAFNPERRAGPRDA